MDLGVFRRSKVAFWAWILGPILLLAVFQHAATIYYDHVQHTLRWQRTFMKVMPDVDEQLTVARESVSAFVSATGARPDGVEELSDQLGREAEQCGFIINSLGVEEGKSKGLKNVGMIEVDIEGEGSLMEIAQFINAIQGDRTLVTVEAGRLRILQLGMGTRYSCEFKLQFYDLTS